MGDPRELMGVLAELGGPVYGNDVVAGLEEVLGVATRPAAEVQNARAGREELFELVLRMRELDAHGGVGELLSVCGVVGEGWVGGVPVPLICHGPSLTCAFDLGDSPRP